MMEMTTIQAESRENRGKGGARALRRKERVPAVIYGPEQTPVSISIARRDILREYHKGGIGRRMFQIQVEGKEYRALTREIQMHPVTDFPQHIDFLAVSKNRPIAVNIPVKFLNKQRSVGIKRGGTLNIVRHDIEVLCNPEAFPEAFEVDLTDYQIGDSIHISHISLPEGVTPIIQDRDFTIATVVGRGGKASQDEDEGVAGEEDGENAPEDE